MKIEKFLPFIISFLLPGLNFLNNNSNRAYVDMWVFIPQWLTASSILLVLWYLLAGIKKRAQSGYYWKAILASILVVLVFMFVMSSVVPRGILFVGSPNFWMMGSKMMVAVAMFITIQKALDDTREVAKLTSENLSLKTEKYRAELEQLRKQVNPHFLFNSLSTLRTMIRSRNENSEEFVLHLSSLYRQILQASEDDIVSLDKELDLLSAYIYLMKVRHEDALDLRLEIAPDVRLHSIPIFSLQLLVENCIKHNVVSTTRPLHIRIYQKSPLSITVANNFQPRQDKVYSTGVGLMNLKNRYALLNVGDGVLIGEANGWYEVTLKLI